MNPDEQRIRRSRTDQLEARIDALELLVMQLMQNDNALMGDNQRHTVNIQNAIRRCDERAVDHDGKIDALQNPSSAASASDVG